MDNRPLREINPLVSSQINFFVFSYFHKIYKILIPKEFAIFYSSSYKKSISVMGFICCNQPAQFSNYGAARIWNIMNHNRIFVQKFIFNTLPIEKPLAVI